MSDKSRIVSSQAENFPLLDQCGPFATLGDPADLNPFSEANRNLLERIKRCNLMTKYRATRNQVFDFLNVNSFAEIQKLIHDSSRREKVSRRGYELLGNMFGIEGNAREIIYKVAGYSRTADGVIRYLKSKVLTDHASYIEMTNEIDAISSPVDLLLIVFDDRYHKKARFEAKRKLILIITNPYEAY